MQVKTPAGKQICVYNAIQFHNDEARLGMFCGI